MHFLLLLGVLFGSLLGMPGIGVGQEVIPLEITADSLHYDEQAKQVVASGSVEVMFKSTTLSAETLHLNTQTNVVTASGNVRLSQAGEEYLGETVTFDVTQEVFSLGRFASVLSNPQVKGDIFAAAETLTNQGGYLRGQEGSFTTCDYDAPHYHLAARTFWYYPNDRVTCYWVTFYLGRVPVMWFPWYTFSLKKQHVSLLMPTYGRNEVEGQFLKNRVSYYIDEGAYGEVPVDWAEKKGTGYGVQHHYQTAATAGALALYHMDERDTGLSDWVIDWDHQHTLSPGTTSTVAVNDSRIYQVPFGRADRTEVALGYARNLASSRFDTNTSFSENRITHRRDLSLGVKGFLAGKIPTQTNFRTYVSRFDGSPTNYWQRLNMSWRQSQPFFSDHWELATAFDYSRFGTQTYVADDERLYPELGLKHYGTLRDGHTYTLNIENKWYLDQDGDQFTGDEQLDFLEKQPEVTLAFSPWVTTDDSWLLDGYRFSPELAWGKFRESKFVPATSRNRVFVGDRYRTSLKVDRTLAVHGGGGGVAKLDLGNTVEQRQYGEGDAQFTVTKNAAMTLASGFFENRVSYQHRFSDGNTPFFFDGFNAEDHTVRDIQIFRVWDKVKLQFDGGYNILRERYYDVLANLDITPTPRLRLQFRSGYDIENQRYRDLYGSLGSRPNDRSRIDGTLQYDLNRGLYRAATSTVETELGDTWQTRTRIRFSHYFDFLSKEYRLRDLMVVKDLHDWDLAIQYSSLLKEFRYTVTFKAFPQQPLGFASSAGVTRFEGLNPEAFQFE